ncbi:MAG: phosphate ABC transporter substrate-binding protein PstS [Deltaproteobacteria bacterium]|nr:phosphate ABC transporter substrate-binding protein PstS [Deltaproteobacteria bacterium]
MQKTLMRMLRVIVLVLMVVLLCQPTIVTAGTKTINGAGASFPYPIYAKWAYLYHKETGVRINYQSIGSGGGIRQIKANSVDFGASDAPLKSEELESSGLIQFPMVVGGVVPVVHLDGVVPGALKLTPGLLADIFLGKITQWNDAALKKINPGLDLPARGITVVHRSDGSGTTWIFSNYLDKTAPEWHARIGFGKALQWPAGIGGKGNEGVAAYVKRIPGAIGYVEYAYALQNRMTHVALENRAGRFVEPTGKSFRAAAANADWAGAKGYYLVLTDQPGMDSWPITGASFILLHREQRDKEKAVALLKFFDWCYRKGRNAALGLYYVPMPDNVVSLMEESWGERLRAGGESVWP